MFIILWILMFIAGAVTLALWFEDAKEQQLKLRKGEWYDT